MELGRYLTVRRRQVVQPHPAENAHEDHLERKRLPFIESPVNDQLYDVLDSDGTPNLEKLRSRASALPAISSTDGPVLYKPRHEASTIELFYDLFFVANLATFTAAHKHSDAECKCGLKGCKFSRLITSCSCWSLSRVLYTAVVHMAQHNPIRRSLRHGFHHRACVQIRPFRCYDCLCLLWPDLRSI